MIKIRPVSFLILFLLMGSTALRAVEVNILYWSDRNARSVAQFTHRDSTLWGGAALLAGLVTDLRARLPRSLTLVAGSEISGSAVANKSRGLSEVQLLNKIGIDAYVPGVRDFDYGWEALQHTMNKADFPVLLANVTVDREGGLAPLFASDTLLDVMGVKVAVIGLLKESFTQSVVPENVYHLRGWESAAVAGGFVAARGQRADVLVAVTHLGWKQDSLLAASVDGLDIIIGSGDHIAFDTVRSVNNTLIVQAGYYGKVLGRLTVDVDTVHNGIVRYEGALIPVIETAAEPDAEISALVENQRGKYLKGLDRQIGILQTDWNYFPDRPCNLAQWVADNLRSVEPRVWVTLISGDDVQKGLARGPITEQDMWDISPFDNPLILFEITGAEIREVVKRQISSGIFPFATWGGLAVRAEGDSLLSLMIQGEEVKWNYKYVALTTGSVWGRLPTYLGLTAVGRPSFPLPGVTQRQFLIDLIKSHKVVVAPFDERWDVK